MANASKQKKAHLSQIERSNIKFTFGELNFCHLPFYLNPPPSTSTLSRCSYCNMLRICTKNNILINKRVLYQTTRYNNNSAIDHSNKIYALPFKLPEEKVHQIVNIASYVNQHAFFSIFKIIKSVSFILNSKANNGLNSK